MQDENPKKEGVIYQSASYLFISLFVSDILNINILKHICQSFFGSGCGILPSAEPYAKKNSIDFFRVVHRGYFGIVTSTISPSICLIRGAEKFQKKLKF